jgi:hypothetical protein
LVVRADTLAALADKLWATVEQGDPSVVLASVAAPARRKSEVSPSGEHIKEVDELLGELQSRPPFRGKECERVMLSEGE